MALCLQEIEGMREKFLFMKRTLFFISLVSITALSALYADDLNNSMIDQARQAWSSGNEDLAREIFRKWSETAKELNSRSFDELEAVQQESQKKKLYKKRKENIREKIEKEGMGEKLSNENLDFLVMLFRQDGFAITSNGDRYDHRSDQDFLSDYINARHNFDDGNELIKNIVRKEAGNSEWIKKEPDKATDILSKIISEVETDFDFYPIMDAFAGGGLELPGISFDRSVFWFGNSLIRYHKVLDALSDESLLFLTGLTSDEINEFMITVESFLKQQNIKDLHDYIKSVKDKAERQRKEAREKSKEELKCQAEENQIEKLKKYLKSIVGFLKNENEDSWQLFADFDRNGRVDERDLKLLEQGFYFGNIMIIIQQIESLQGELNWINGLENMKEAIEIDQKNGRKDILSECKRQLERAIEEKRVEVGSYRKFLAQSLKQNELKIDWATIANNLAFADLNRDFRFNEDDIKEMRRIVNLWKDVPEFKRQEDVDDFFESHPWAEIEKLIPVVRRSRGEEFMILLSEKEKIKSFRKKDKKSYREFNPLEYPWLDLMTAINRQLRK